MFPAVTYFDVISIMRFVIFHSSNVAFYFS